MSGLDEEAKKQAAGVTASTPEEVAEQSEAERLEKRKQAFLDVFVDGRDSSGTAEFPRVSNPFKTEKDASEIRHQVSRMFTARVLKRLIDTLEQILDQGRGVDFSDPKRQFQITSEFWRLIGHELAYSRVNSDYPYDDAYNEMADFIKKYQREDHKEKYEYKDFEDMLSGFRGIQARKGPDDEEQKLWDMLGFTSEDREKIAGARREREERYGKS